MIFLDIHLDVDVKTGKHVTLFDALYVVKCK